MQNSTNAKYVLHFNNQRHYEYKIVHGSKMEARFVGQVPSAREFIPICFFILAVSRVSEHDNLA